MKALKKIFKSVILVGCEGPLGSSHNRITIFSNAIGIYGVLVIALTIPTLYKFDVPIRLFVYNWIAIGMLCILGIYFNYTHKFLISRVLAVILLNAVAWDAMILFGKTFNGFMYVFAAVMYAVLALSKAQVGYRIFCVSFSALGLPLMDYFSHRGILPVTGFHSSNFHLSVLIVPSVFLMCIIIIFLTVERYFSDAYEAELQTLNENLEDIVQKRTALLVTAKEEAVQASLLRSQFVANTSHELRTPVQGIIGFLELAKSRLANLKIHDEKSITLKEKVNKSLESAEVSSERLLNLVETLLNITRTESEGFTPKPVKISVENLLSKIIKEVRVEYGSDKAIIVENKSLQKEIFSDDTLLTQALQNLLVNAVRYSNKESPVRIVVEDILESQISFRVSNVGVGIHEKDVQRIFDPFVQGINTDQSVGGTGLGLALCKRYAHALKGDVLLIDPSPENTAFELNLPIHLRLSPH